jgi:3D (Asp-Asp-Asp) domain-containing protein
VTRLQKVFFATAVVLSMLLSCAPVLAATADNAAPQLPQSPQSVVQDKAAEKTSEPIKLGSAGEEVKFIQKMLADYGFYSGDFDGVFGNGTLKAVQDFQAFNNLPADGIVGKDTLLSLRRANSEPSRYSRSLTMTASGYSRFDDGCGSYTANGSLLRKGLVAVDPRVIPLGTRLFITGYGYAVADDTGGAIKGNRIDLAFDSHPEASQFGMQKVTVFIID